MATLEQFLRTGELGPLHPGMGEDEVIALLGGSIERSVAKQHQILKFGGLQLTFLRYQGGADRELCHIGLYFRPNAEPIPELAQTADFRATAETTIADIRGFLARVGLHDSAAFGVDDTNHMFFPSGARITFDGDKLHSVIFVTRKSTPHKKQVSVSVAEDSWKRLKTLARASNRSVSQLCSDWIAQRVSEVEHDDAQAIGNRS